MCPTTMHKHISDKLVKVKVWGQEEMQTKDIVHPTGTQHVHMTRKHADEKNRNIDNEQAFSNDRYISHTFLSFSIIWRKITKNIR
jgi:hypothetical protein